MTTSEMISKLERSLLRYCAPTLAGLKPASLFNFHLLCDGCKDCHCSEEKVAGREALFSMALLMCNAKLGKFGVQVEVLAMKKSGPLLYVYRPDHVQALLEDTRVRTFLESLGYRCDSCAACLAQLRKRVAQALASTAESDACAFPHEIGLLLGYPYTDVIEFIERDGKGGLLAGCWKAYSNERDAQECFCRYKNCTATFERFYEAGMPIESLAVIGFNRLKAA